MKGLKAYQNFNRMQQKVFNVSLRKGGTLSTFRSFSFMNSSQKQFKMKFKLSFISHL